MTPEIEKRIKLVQAGKVPAGYKRTKIGIVPKEWQTVLLGTLFSDRNESNCSSMELLSITADKGIIPRSEIEGKDNSSEDKSKYKRVYVGDIAYNTMRMWQGVSALSLYDGIVSPAYTVLNPIKSICVPYFSYLFKMKSLINCFYRNSQGLVDDTRSLKYEWFKKIVVDIPPKKEQEKIAEILAAQDRVIELKEKLIAEKQKQKKVLVQTFFYKSERKTPKLNVEGISLDKRHWKDVSIESVLKKVDNPVKKEKNTFYTQIGIYSHGKGLFYKEPVTGGSLGNKSVFWIEPNCFILNIVFAWEQAVAKTSDKERGFIASHRFPMFKPVDNRIDVDYAVYFFLTKRGTEILDAASPGGAGRNRTLGQERFLKSKITLPSLPEQQAIAKVLSAADEEISLLQKDLEQEKLKKKSLMQLLLTGLVRVSA